MAEFNPVSFDAFDPVIANVQRRRDEEQTAQLLGQAFGSPAQSAQTSGTQTSGSPAPGLVQAAQQNPAILAKLLSSPNAGARAVGAMILERSQPQRGQFITAADGTVLYGDPTTQSVRPVYQGGPKPQAPQPGYRATPTGVEPIPGSSADPNALVDQRRKIAAASGLTEGSPSWKAYMATGKLPREDQNPLSATDKKAIMEADDAVLANQSAIEGLTRAKTLSGQALSGPGATTRATIANNLPDWMVPDFIASPEQGQATAELENTVTTNALNSLKAIFGAAPTEGERAILLQIQGSANQPPAVREKIYDNAIQLAQRRLEFNKKRAEELRGQTYYQQGQPQGAPQAAPQGQQQGNNPALTQARDAIARGANRAAVIQRLQSMGIDPAGL